MDQETIVEMTASQEHTIENSCPVDEKVGERNSTDSVSNAPSNNKQEDVINHKKNKLVIPI